jgi:8-oxo-dGTP diphosphatase
MSSIRINANALILRDGKLLLIKFDDENGVHYNLPGGGVEKGESVLAALERECHEEARARIQNPELCLTWQYVPELENFRYGDRQKLGFIFKAALRPGCEPGVPAKPDKNQVGIEWVPLAEIFAAKKFPLFPEIVPQIRDALERNRGIGFVEACPPAIYFKTIDLIQDREICIQFRRDSFVASFGPDEKTWPQKFNAEDYMEWLKSKQDNEPSNAVHVWLDHAIIGQLELGRLREAPEIGYVNLYYLAPAYRGKAYSKLLELYVERILKSRGHEKARLSVSPTNLRALAYYRKHGWKEMGERKDMPGVVQMEKNLSPK